MSLFDPASSSPWGRTGGHTTSHIPTTTHQLSSRPRRSMCNPPPRSSLPPRRLARLLLPPRSPYPASAIGHALWRPALQGARVHQRCGGTTPGGGGGGGPGGGGGRV